MSDIYLYDDVPVLKNKLGIKNSDLLDAAEAGMSRTNMMLLYESGFQDFSPAGLCEIHRRLFSEVYEWAGKFRTINIEKRERLLAGRSVWYSNDDNIPSDLYSAFDKLLSQPWDNFSREKFVFALARYFPPIWQIHPFREGNTRSIVMMMSLFVEHHGFYIDHELLAVSAGYVRNSFGMACLGQYSEFEHLEKILLNAVCSDSVFYEKTDDGPEAERSPRAEKYTKYQKEPYKPEPHYEKP